jgi:hypothetical protein
MVTMLVTAAFTRAGPDPAIWPGDTPMWQHGTPGKYFAHRSWSRSFLRCIIALCEYRFALPGPSEWWELAGDKETRELFDTDENVPRRCYSSALAALGSDLPPAGWYEHLYHPEDMDNGKPFMWR